MDDILVTTEIGNGRRICLAALSRETIAESGAEHLGFEGYFIFETNEIPGEQGIVVLGKVASFDAAIRLIDVLRLH